MSKIIKTVFVLLSIVLVCALVIACVTVAKNGGDESSLPPVLSSEAPSSEAPSSQDNSVISEEPSSEDSSVISTEPSSEELSSMEPSFEDSSEDVSLPPVNVGDREPITTPPTGTGLSDADAYFNNSLFVGHSVMVHFKNYVTSWRKTYGDGFLGNALFACSSSFSFYNNAHQLATDADSVLPKYQGQGYKIEELTVVTGVDTVYIGLMGLNDLGMVGKADTCARLVADEVIECINKIKQSNADVNIVVLASTYLVRGHSYRNLNNRNMSLLNSYMLEYCNENGIDFIDVATPLTDGGGYLADVYCSDNYCHLKKNAYYVWMNLLRDYAERKQAGTWQNPTAIRLFED